MKTPKEYADELISKMYNTEFCGITHFPNNHYCDCSEINEFQARQCAVIYCKEVLGYMGADRGYEFWISVLYELEHYGE